MNILEEKLYSKLLIEEAKKLNPSMGYFAELTNKPLSGDVTVRLSNGTARIGRLILHEFARSGKKTPRSFIEEVAWSFESKK
jgi:hypothetical protein